MRHHRLSTTAVRCSACLSSGLTFGEQDRLHLAAQKRYARKYGTGPGVSLPRSQVRRRVCTCRPAKTSSECFYCGGGWEPNVCGRCAYAGIDGRTIPGTARRVCGMHRGCK